MTCPYALDDPGGHGIVHSWHCNNWHQRWVQHVLGAAARLPILVGECRVNPMKMDFIPAAAQEDLHDLGTGHVRLHPEVSPELEWLLHASAFFATDANRLEIHADATLRHVVNDALGEKLPVMKRMR